MPRAQPLSPHPVTGPEKCYPPTTPMQLLGGETVFKFHTPGKAWSGETARKECRQKVTGREAWQEV